MPNNIIMADAKGVVEYETVSLPNAVTNGENLKTTIDSMNLPPVCLIVTTKKTSDVVHMGFTLGIINQNGKITNAYRWDGSANANAAKELKATYDFKANAGDEFYIVPCPQT